MTEEKDYYVLTDSKEKFEEIENAYRKFRENYVLVGGGKLIIRENPYIHKNIGIYPETKYGEITEIETKKENLEGRILKCSQDNWIIQIGKDKYLIHSKNPDFKVK